MLHQGRQTKTTNGTNVIGVNKVIETKVQRPIRTTALAARNLNAVVAKGEKECNNKGAVVRRTTTLRDVKNQPIVEKNEKKGKNSLKEGNKVSHEFKKLEKFTDCTNASRGVQKVQSYSVSRFDNVVIYCEEYTEDVFDYIFWLEHRNGVEKDFLRGCEVTPKMRAILVDWLIQVQVRFHMLPETLYVTINLLDRYLSKGIATKSNLQLIGITCMYIASKYEEMFPPELLDFVYITDNSITQKDITRMEVKIFSTIGFDLGRPNVILFIRQLSSTLVSSVHTMAKFIGESAVSDYGTCYLLPSQIAAVAVYLAVKLEEFPFPNTFYAKARISQREVEKWTHVFAQQLLKVHSNQKLTALRSKYASTKNSRVAMLTINQIEVLSRLARN